MRASRSGGGGGGWVEAKRVGRRGRRGDDECGRTRAAPCNYWPEGNYAGPELINSVGRNLTDLVPPNFKIGDFIIYGFKIFEKYKNM
jgi:hypothetical protein